MSLIQVKRSKPENNQLERVKRQMIKSGCLKFSLNIPRAIHRKFKVKALQEGKEMCEIIMPMILKYIEDV
jgi:hypothetical protein